MQNNKIDLNQYQKLLTLQQIKEIAKIQLNYLSKRLSEQDLLITFSDALLELIGEFGFNTTIVCNNN